LAFILSFFSVFCAAEENQQLTVEQQWEFLLNAKVIRSREAGAGVTRTMRLTLSDGKITHDASFQSIDERRSYKQLDSGGEANFVDSYLYNLAAYELAKLLGLDDMLPVTVKRKWRGDSGSLTWWLPVKMTLGEKEDRKIPTPDVGAWNKSMYKIRVFAELIYDTDRNNPGNILIGNDWKLYMVDFSRAFRLYHELKKPENLVCCSRELLAKLRALDGNTVAATVGKYLNKLEVEGLMKRRDKIVAIFDNLIEEKREDAVLY
jgi:hypothetical protein